MQLKTRSPLAAKDSTWAAPSLDGSVKTEGTSPQLARATGPQDARRAMLKHMASGEFIVGRGVWRNLKMLSVWERGLREFCERCDVASPLRTTVTSDIEYK